MQITPVSLNNSIRKEQTFGHGHDFLNSGYSKKDKAIVAGTTALGVAASLGVLAKMAGHSVNPVKVIKSFKNIKNSYLAKVKYHEKEVITIGAGSALGGLAGGYIIDKNPENRKAKRRETLMQIGNVSIPIITVEAFAKLGDRFGKAAKSLSAIAGIFAGVYLANFLMNHLSNAIFKSDKGARGVKGTDFSAHLDDMVVAASYISDAKPVYLISRVIPLALLFAGNEVGNKTTDKPA